MKINVFNLWYFIGVILIIIGIFVIFFSLLLTKTKYKKSNTEISIVGIIGFIPFAISTSKKTLIFTIILSLIFILFMILLIHFIWFMG